MVETQRNSLDSGVTAPLLLFASSRALAVGAHHRCAITIPVVVELSDHGVRSSSASSRDDAVRKDRAPYQLRVTVVRWGGRARRRHRAARAPRADLRARWTTVTS